MRNANILKSITSVSFAAALSIALTACSDDSSSGVDPVYTPAQTSTVLRIKDYTQECKSDIDPTFIESDVTYNDAMPAEEQFSATMITGQDSTEFQVGDFYTACSDYLDSVEASVSGDTIQIKVSIIIGYPQADCICPKRLSFKVENSALPNQINHIFVNGEEVPQLAAGTTTPTLYTAKNFNAECKNSQKDYIDVPADNLPKPVGEYSESPTATRTFYGEGNATIVIDELTVACGTAFENVSIQSSGDTLIVHADIDLTNGVAKCLCPTRISFEVENVPDLSNTTVLVFNESDPIQLIDQILIPDPAI